MTADAIPPRYRLDAYRFDLPGDRIAQEPVAERTASRLLVLDRRSGARAHRVFADLPAFLRPGDCLVVNDTRVFPARMQGRKASGGRVELLVTRLGHRDFEAMFGTNRGLRPGVEIAIDGRDGGVAGAVRATAVRADGTASFETLDGHAVADLVAAAGHVPLPPYIRREGADPREGLDRERYQTVYAREDGAVAAPTAGLHFTPALLERIGAMGVGIARVTLHVGPGTFKPVKVDDVRQHDVGEERYAVPPATADAVNEALAAGRRVVAVGTTSVRTLETAGRTGRVAAGEGATRLLITPGFRFRVTGAMVTNFHLPGSSLLLLVSAFAGRRRVLAAYREAVREGYRFYSYGDAMLIA